MDFVRSYFFKKVSKCFVPVQIFWASPKIWSNLVPLQKLLCQHKNQFYWMKIIFLSSKKCLWLAQYVNEFLLWHKNLLFCEIFEEAWTLKIHFRILTFDENIDSYFSIPLLQEENTSLNINNLHHYCYYPQLGKIYSDVVISKIQQTKDRFT